MSQPPSDPGQRDRILCLLHADRAKAAVRLDLLERRIECFFRWERVTDPSASAAAVLRELMTQIETGAEVLDPESFTLDLARQHRDRSSVRRADPQVPLDTAGMDSVPGWLAGLITVERDLLLNWFPFDPAKRRSARLGLSPPSARDNHLAQQAIGLRERCTGFVRQNRP